MVASTKSAADVLRAQADQREHEAAELRALADVLDATPAPSAPVERRTISLKQAAFVACRSESTIRRWVKKCSGLGFQSVASDEWRIDERVLSRLLFTERGEFGGENGEFGG
jgi:hypothetical protein